VMTDTRQARPQTAEAAGELRQRLRAAGWRTDVGWSDVGSRSAQVAVQGAGGAPTRRTIAYVPRLRAVDGGAGRLWMDGDVAAPPEADAREVMIARPDSDEWQSETFEAPLGHVAAGNEPTERAA
jgi:hypothetical protein